MDTDPSTSTKPMKGEALDGRLLPPVNELTNSLETSTPLFVVLFPWL